MTSSDSQILNLRSADPFGDGSSGINDISGGDNKTELNLGSGLVHIRIQQRNGRKTLTTVQGLESQFDKKKLVRAFKKEFACNGTVVEHPEYGEVIQLQGDQRNNVCLFLTRYKHNTTLKYKNFFVIWCFKILNFRIGIVKEAQLKVGHLVFGILLHSSLSKYFQLF